MTQTFAYGSVRLFELPIFQICLGQNRQGIWVQPMTAGHQALRVLNSQATITQSCRKDGNHDRCSAVENMGGRRTQFAAKPGYVYVDWICKHWPTCLS